MNQEADDVRPKRTWKEDIKRKTHWFVVNGPN